ncbi:MAG: hypothetical protein WBO49_02315 [Candidatus Saccharimonas sp.]
MSEFLYGNALDVARQRLTSPDAYLHPRDAGFTLLHLSRLCLDHVIGYTGPRINRRHNNPLSDLLAAHRKKLEPYGDKLALTPALTFFGTYDDTQGIAAVPLIPSPEVVRQRKQMDTLDSIEHVTVVWNMPPEVAQDAPHPEMMDGYSIRFEDKITLVVRPNAVPRDTHAHALQVMAERLPEVTMLQQLGADITPIL